MPWSKLSFWETSSIHSKFTIPILDSHGMGWMTIAHYSPFIMFGPWQRWKMWHFSKHGWPFLWISMKPIGETHLRPLFLKGKFTPKNHINRCPYRPKKHMSEFFIIRRYLDPTHVFWFPYGNPCWSSVHPMGNPWYVIKTHQKWCQHRNWNNSWIPIFHG